MKVLILAGGFGTRLSEETQIRPKPMVEIGGKPILWHIMKIYSHYGFNDFVVLLGYKGYHIKEYFANYFLHQNDVTIDLENNTVQMHKNSCEPWKITLIDTGITSNTGGRVKLAQPYVKDEEFMLTYGDGVSDINIEKLLHFHRGHDNIVTMSAVQPEGRYGIVDIDENENILSFIEKPKGDNVWINGGFFVCRPEVFDYIDDAATSFENITLKRLADEKKLSSYKHFGFWKCMDTLRDKHALNKMWDEDKASWKLWK